MYSSPVPNTPDTTHRLVLALHRAAATVERRLDRALSNVRGISYSEYLLLRALGDEHEAAATRVDLARAVGVTPSGVTRALRPLEKLGYVKTTKDARDARRSLARLTPAGADLVADATAVVDDMAGDIGPIRSLSASDRKRLSALLEALASG